MSYVAGAFNRGVSESLIPEEETKTGDNTTDKKSKRGRKQKRKEKQREEDITEQEASKQAKFFPFFVYLLSTCADDRIECRHLYG